MGIKMMVEILDHWQDAGLTVGERSDLLVLAENANDGTRLTFGPVHEEYILRRAGKTAESWRVAISRLMKKKVLEFASRDGRELRGRTGQYAVYRLPELCPKPPHSGYKGHCTKPAERSSDQGYPSANPPKGDVGDERYQAANPEGYPADNAVDREGYQADTEWVSSQVTPTPPVSSFKTPSNTPSSSVAEPIEDVPAAESAPGGGGGSDLRSMAEQITAALDYRGKPPSRQQQNQITDRLVAALQAGWTVDQLAVHLDITGQDVRYPAAVYLARLDPARIATPPAPQVPSARRGGARAEPLPAEAYAGVTTGSLLFEERRDTADGGMWERAMQRAQQKTAAMAGGGGHRPYSNDVWTQPADPVEAARIPYCGDHDCDPVSRLKDHRDSNGLVVASPCEKCHPKMQW